MADFDDYEMKEREQEAEQQEQERIREEQEIEQANREQETNFDDDDDVVVDIGGRDREEDKSRDRQDQLDDQLDDIGDLLDDIGKDTHNVRRATTNNIKKVIKNVFDVSLEKKNGTNSKGILEDTKFISSGNGRLSIEYKGSRIGWVERNLNVNLFEKKNKKLVDEFKQSLEFAKMEYEKSPSSLVRDLPENVVDSILDSSIERVDEVIEETAATLSDQDLREFAGILDPKGATAEVRIKALEIQAEYWEKVKLEAKEVADSDDVTAEESSKARSKQALFDSLEKTANLQADNERLKNNEKPIHDETLEIINDEISTRDLGRLERFKEWAKNNLIGLSAIAITIAGIGKKR